ncbi:MAG: MFS transporter [Clostridia bacterium]|nr:MFS transporter [Clostridia bacterium]
MKNIVSYGIGNLSYSIIANTISNFFMFYGTSVIGLGGTLTGIAVAIGTAWNGLGDPVVGFVSDKFPLGKFGRRKGYMLIACIAMAAINLAVWCVPLGMNTVLKFLWVLMSLIIIQTAVSFYTTPYSALGVDLATNKNKNTRLMVSRTCFMFVGMVLPSVLFTLFLPNSIEYPVGQLNPNGYRYIAYVCSTVCLVCALLCIFFTKNKQVSDTKPPKSINIKQMFKHFVGIFKHKNLRNIIIGSAMSDVSAVILMSIGMHFFTYCFYYSSTQITIILISLLLGASLSQVVWYKLSKKDKLQTILISIFVTTTGVFAVMLVYVFRFELNYISYYFCIVGMFICGAGSGALYTIPLSIYNDEVKKINENYSDDRTATYTGMLTFTSSAVTALSQLISGALLDIIKFDANLIDQSLGVQTGLALILFGGIMSVLIASFYFFGKYNKQK